jgi:hypothetical protein
MRTSRPSLLTGAMHMNKDFLVTVVIIVTIVAVYAGVLAAVLPIDVNAIGALTLPGK